MSYTEDSFLLGRLSNVTHFGIFKNSRHPGQKRPQRRHQRRVDKGNTHACPSLTNHRDFRMRTSKMTSDARIVHRGVPACHCLRDQLQACWPNEMISECHCGTNQYKINDNRESFIVNRFIRFVDKYL